MTPVGLEGCWRQPGIGGNNNEQDTHFRHRAVAARRLRAIHPELQRDTGGARRGIATLQIRPVGGSFTNSGSLGNSGATYTGTTPRQGPGEYEARLSVEYRPALTAASKTKTSGIRPYTLAWPAGTFGFEQGNPGWYLNGVLNVADDFNGCGIDQLNASPYFHYTSAGWPLGIGYVNPGFPAGALRVGGWWWEGGRVGGWRGREGEWVGGGGRG